MELVVVYFILHLTLNNEVKTNFVFSINIDIN